MGPFIRVPDPLPVKSMITGDITFIETRSPVIFMKQPPFSNIPVNYSIQGNNSLDFVEKLSYHHQNIYSIINYTLRYFLLQVSF